MGYGSAFSKVGVIAFFVVLCLAMAVGVQAAEKKEIIIGASLPLSGPQAAPGADLKWAYEQAAADVNKGGGIPVKEYGKKLPVKLVILDDESDAGKAASAVEKLIKLEKVDLLLPTHSTPMVIASCITAEKYKKYLHGVGLHHPGMAAAEVPVVYAFLF